MPHVRRQLLLLGDAGRGLRSRCPSRRRNRLVGDLDDFELREGTRRSVQDFRLRRGQELFAVRLQRPPPLVRGLAQVGLPFALRIPSEATLKTATGSAASPPASTSPAVMRPKYLCSVCPALTNMADISKRASPEAIEWQANTQGMRCFTT